MLLYMFFAAYLALKVVGTYLEDVVDINKGKEILAFESADDFQPLPLSYRAYKQWPSLTSLQKSVYLMDHSFVVNAKRAFDDLADVMEKHTSQLAISLPGLIKKWQEFTTESSITAMFSECNTTPDSVLDWYEFLLCRSSYDQHGKPHDVAEFDLLETVVMQDFAARLQDPRDPMTLQLLARDEL